MYDLVTIGDTKLDVFIELGREAKVACALNRKDCTISVQYGGKIPVHSALTTAAGSALNVALGARRLGLATTIISQMGDDAAYHIAIKLLKAEGIAHDYVTSNKNSDSSFSAILNFDGESTILAAHRPFNYSWPKNVKTRWVFVGEMGTKFRPLYRELTAAAKKSRFKIAINPGAFELKKIDRALLNMLASCSIITVNREEAKKIAGIKTDNIKTLLRTLRQIATDTVIITDGERGAHAMTDHSYYFAPPFHARRIEATGAGDAFSAGVLSALIQEKNIEEALRWGAINSASVIEHIGPQKGLLKRHELISRLRAHS